MAGFDAKYENRIYVGIFITEVLVFVWPRGHDVGTQHAPFLFSGPQLCNG